MGMDDWERASARQAAPAPAPSPAPAEGGVVRGVHFPNATLIQRVLTACDGGDVSACHAFASSVQPAS